MSRIAALLALIAILPIAALSPARANTGTWKRYIIPYLVPYTTLAPAARLELDADGSKPALWLSWRLAPVVFHVSDEGGEWALLPFMEFEAGVVGMEEPEAPFRFSTGLEAEVWPDDGPVGLQVTGGFVVGHGGPGGYVEGGVLAGASYARFGLSYRHTWTEHRETHAVTLRLALAWAWES